MEIKIRKAEEKDLYNISRVYYYGWKEAYKEILLKEFLDNLEFNEIKTINKDQNLVAEVDKRIVGVVNFGDGRDSVEKDYGEIRAIYVLPEFWNRGIGKNLLNESIELLKVRNYNYLYLWTLKENTLAIGFYKKMGFKETEEKRNITIGNQVLEEIKYLKKI